MGEQSAHIIVSGLVQGVGFRFFTARKAGALGITGFVRNLPDGTVEVLARGDRGMIREFIGELKAGPRSARVSSVTVGWLPSEEEYDSFEIR